MSRWTGHASLWVRRAAAVSLIPSVRKGLATSLAFRIAAALHDDREDLIQKAVGWMLREAGKRDPARQAAFLERHAATMPRVMLRYAIEKLDKPTRDRWLAMKRPPDSEEDD